MSLVFFEGPAGCGKTRASLDAAEQALPRYAPEQSILGLTYYNGSRHRMEESLCSRQATARRHACRTFDSLAHYLIQRWHSLATSMAGENLHALGFDEKCRLAGRLLSVPSVRSWVAAQHPIVLVDEAQDLDASRLAMLTALSPSVDLIVAADEFQNLDGEQPNLTVDWLRAGADPVVLKRNHRTENEVLLAAASAIRSGTKPGQGKGFRVVAVAAPGLGAFELARFLHEHRNDKVGILMPSRKGGFSPNAVSRVVEKPIGQNGRFGPFDVHWEEDETAECDRIASLLTLDREVLLTNLRGQLNTRKEEPVLADLARALRRQGLLSSHERTTKDAVLDALKEHIRIRRRLKPYNQPRRQAMTIHQAKNREFDAVAVLWCHKIPINHEIQRRWLYNGVTRAKKGCTVIVFDPPKKGVTKPARITVPPFSSHDEQEIH